MKYKMIVEYDGSYFHGFQRQSKEISVQEKIEQVLSEITKEEIKINGAGRTDAGVHAYGQVISCKTSRNIPPENLKKIMNKKLYPHIYIRNIEITTDSFHPRIDAIKKEYHYKVSINNYDPLKVNYYYFFHDRIDISKIRKAMEYIKGTHDFRSLCKTKEEKNTIRTIEKFDLIIKDGILEFTIIGDGFLRNMVRIIIALVLRVGEGKIKLEDVESIINGKNRKLAPWVAPANGLYLWKVYYKNEV